MCKHQYLIFLVARRTCTRKQVEQKINGRWVQIGPTSLAFWLDWEHLSKVGIIFFFDILNN
jgi:hypothetical protein